MALYLLRHGETAWNQEKRIQGTRDIPLNETGRRQVTIACTALLRVRAIDRIVASPLRRAWQSALICAQMCGAPLTADGRFAERHFGELEGQTMAAIYELYGGLDPEQLYESRFGVESISQMQRRITNGLRHLGDYDNQHVLLITHGSVIKHMAKLPAVPANGAIMEWTKEMENGEEATSGKTTAAIGPNWTSGC